MKLSYDERASAAYLRLRSDNDGVGVASSKTLTPPRATDLDDRLALDFDDAGRLIGIEFLTPELRLLPSLLAEATSSRP